MQAKQRSKQKRVRRRAREEGARQRLEAERNALLAKVQAMEMGGKPPSLGMFFVLCYRRVTCYRGNIAAVTYAVTHEDPRVTKILGNAPTVTHVVTLYKTMVTQFSGNTPAITQVVTLYKTLVTQCVGNTPGVPQVVTLCKTTVCVSVFSGGSLAKPYSPPTSRQLTTGEQFHMHEHHAANAPNGPAEVPKPASAQE